MVATVQTHKQVVAIFTAAFLYGLYTSTLLFCFRWLLFADEGWKRRKLIKWPMVAVTTSIFLLTAAHLAIALASTMTAVYDTSYLPHDSLHPTPFWYSIAQCTLANLTALLADSVLMYRCWVVCNKNVWVILFPTILWLGGLICTVLQAYLQTLHARNTLISIVDWRDISAGPGMILTPFWGSTAVLNFYCTIMLVSKINRAAKASGHGVSIRQFNFIICAIAESGFLYLSTTIAYFVVWLTANNDTIAISSALVVPLIGISFNLILIRTGENRAGRERASDSGRSRDDLLSLRGSALESASNDSYISDKMSQNDCTPPVTYHTAGGAHTGDSITTLA